MAKVAEINLKVTLDETKTPVSIHWDATDAPERGEKSCDGLLLSIWDPQERNTLSFDLWTRKMTVDEMNFFVLERLLKLADTHRNATGQEEVAGMISRFGHRLAEKLEQLAKQRMSEMESPRDNP